MKEHYQVKHSSVSLVKTIDYWKNMEARNLPEVKRWCRQSGILGEVQQEAWGTKINEDPAIEMFGIQADDNMVGTCGLTDINYIHSTAEYSMLIFPEEQGNGYATQGLRLLLDHAFLDLGLYNIWGEIFKENRAGKSIAQKLGFTYDGTLRSRYFKEGKRIDTEIWSILATEWKHE
jgi:diamine N-acetyltransferase